MSLTETIQEQIKAALRKGDKQRLGVLRMVLSELKVAQVSGGQYDEVAVVHSYAKKLQSAAAQYEGLHVSERAEQCRAELSVVEEFLPTQMTQQQVEALVEGLIAERGYGPRDIGTIMREIMAAHKDVVEGRLVQKIVKDKLSERP